MEGMNLNDKELWSCFKQGDNDALKLIYYRHFKPLYNYGRKFTGDQGLVEDNIQELFLDLLSKKEKLGDTDNIRLYLLKSIKRRIIRKLYKERKVETIDFSFFDFAETEIQADKKAIDENLRNAINKLSEQQKEIIYLKYFNFLGNKEIAELLEINYQTVRNVLVIALKKLRKSKSLISYLFLIFQYPNSISKRLIH